MEACVPLIQFWFTEWQQATRLQIKGGDSVAQPEIVFRPGRCSAAVFQNESKRGEDAFTGKSVAFQHLYRGKIGEWQNSDSLRANDIPNAVLVLNKAYNVCYVSSPRRR